MELIIALINNVTRVWAEIFKKKAAVNFDAIERQRKAGEKFWSDFEEYVTIFSLINDKCYRGEKELEIIHFVSESLFKHFPHIDNHIQGQEEARAIHFMKKVEEHIKNKSGVFEPYIDVPLQSMLLIIDAITYYFCITCPSTLKVMKIDLLIAEEALEKTLLSITDNLQIKNHHSKKQKIALKKYQARILEDGNCRLHTFINEPKHQNVRDKIIKKIGASKFNKFKAKHRDIPSLFQPLKSINHTGSILSILIDCCLAELKAGKAKLNQTGTPT